MSPPQNSCTDVEAREDEQEDYTVLSPRVQKLVIVLLGMAMLLSPLTATIYLPLLPLLSAHFHTSAQAINLTITVYIAFQALSPLLLSSTSDHFGRRPILLGTFTLYTVASLGLAINTSSYPALLVLRALQSLGASAVLSISYGCVADISVPAKRGKMLGPMLAAGNVGTCVGPIVGGWVALVSGGYRWAFWALCIFGGFILCALVFLLPETARQVVGNGSIEDRRWNQPIWRLIRRSGRGTHTNASQPRRSPKVSSPLAAIKILFHKDTPFIIWLSSSYYALWYCVQATIPSTFKSPIYRFNELQIGLAYLPGAFGVILSMYVTGKFMDWSYKATADKMGFTINRVKGDDITKFPIEDARSRWCEVLIPLSMCTMVGYGWSIEMAAHVSIPLILQFLQGFLVTWLIQVFSALLVDTFPETPSTASTAGNMTRCVVSAVAVAMLQPLIEVMGKGWLFTFVGLVSGIGGVVSLMILRRRGMKWRTSRRMAYEQCDAGSSSHTNESSTGYLEKGSSENEKP